MQMCNHCCTTDLWLKEKLLKSILNRRSDINLTFQMNGIGSEDTFRLQTARQAGGVSRSKWDGRDDREQNSGAVGLGVDLDGV